MHMIQVLNVHHWILVKICETGDLLLIDLIVMRCMRQIFKNISSHNDGLCGVRYLNSNRPLLLPRNGHFEVVRIIF